MQVSPKLHFIPMVAGALYICMASAALIGPALAQSAGTTVEASAGTFAGEKSGMLTAYKGIPFALPPVGDLRWQPPQPAPVSSGVFDATQFANHCPQENAQDDPNADEDCLYLNVYVPNGGNDKDASYPVMFWIHGGANGWGASDFYDPSQLVTSQDVIVVTVNYRLGALGFLAHPELNPDAPVNLGIMDQQLALQWVKDNIDAFGGDANQVTLFGESAGALNTMSHLISRQSFGLFDKAIIQSGGYWLETETREDADTRGLAFADRIGCTGENVAQCLRDKTVAEVLANQGAVNTPSAAYFQMVLDGHVLHRTQRDAFISGDFNRVPIINGSNANEGNLFYGDSATEETYNGAVAEFSRQNHKMVAWTEAVYPLTAYESPRDAARVVLGDSEFSCPAMQLSNWLSNWTPTFAYEFSDPESLAGSGHFADIYYLFKFKDQTNFGIEGSKSSKQLAEAMQVYWANFAKYSNPNGEGLPIWPNYSLQSRELQQLSVANISTQNVGATAGFIETHNCQFWGHS